MQVLTESPRLGAALGNLDHIQALAEARPDLERDLLELNIWQQFCETEQYVSARYSSLLHNTSCMRIVCHKAFAKLSNRTTPVHDMPACSLCTQANTCTGKLTGIGHAQLDISHVLLYDGGRS